MAVEIKDMDADLGEICCENDELAEENILLANEMNQNQLTQQEEFKRMVESLEFQ